MEEHIGRIGDPRLSSKAWSTQKKGLIKGGGVERERTRREHHAGISNARNLYILGEKDWLREIRGIERTKKKESE